MKQFKYFSFLLAILTTLAMGACGNNDSPLDDIAQTGSVENGSNTDSSETDTSSATNGSKTLVVYFSRTGYNYVSTDGSTGRITEWLDKGHTAVVADFIAGLTGADRFEILATDPYPDDYMACVERSHQEQAADARPQIKDSLENISAYDTVFVGAPVWSGRMPMIIHTFYESYDLSGKVLVPFTTHAGSGLANAKTLMQNYFPTATVLDGFSVQGTKADDSRDAVGSWLERIGIVGD